jgi:predicted alternative tryptophan synthase beta-subunit
MKRAYGALAAFVTTIMVSSVAAMAAVDTGVTSLVTSTGADIKDTALASIGILIPLAVGVYLARKAFSWAKAFIR